MTNLSGTTVPTNDDDAPVAPEAPSVEPVPASTPVMK